MVGPGTTMRAAAVEGDFAAAPWSWTGVHADGLGPWIVEGGTRRRGRARLAALTLVAMAESVAVAAPVASTILAMAALSATAKWMRQSRGRRDRDVVGVECLQGRLGRVGAECEFLLE
jgi:hypothetical protein